MRESQNELVNMQWQEHEQFVRHFNIPKNTDHVLGQRTETMVGKKGQEKYFFFLKTAQKWKFLIGRYFKYFFLSKGNMCSPDKFYYAT